MQDVFEQILDADHLEKMDLAEQAMAAPSEYAAVVAACESVEDQQRGVTAIVDKWLEDGAEGAPWEAPPAVLVELRARLLEQWEAADREELDSMQIYRMSYLYSVGVLASIVRDPLHDKVAETIETRLVGSDVDEDARGILRQWFQRSVD